jgi:hypothetical protein
MDRTETVNLGAAGLDLGARLYVGGVAQDASGVVTNDRGSGDYDFDVPLSPPYSLLVYEVTDPARALWNFERAAPLAFQPVAVPVAVVTATAGLVSVVAGSDSALVLQVAGLPFDPSGAVVELDLVRIGGLPTIAGLAAQVQDVVTASGRWVCTLTAALPWSAWPTSPVPVTGYYFGRFSLVLGGSRHVVPADTSLRLELTGEPS